METKKRIRTQKRIERNQLTPRQLEEKSRLIMEQVRQEPSFQNAGHVLLYLAYEQEVSTDYLWELAKKEKKHVYAPKVIGENMVFYEIFSRNDLEEGYKGILEPKGDTIPFLEEWSKQAVMIMPGVAFDGQRNRIGYGKGFYDRFLCHNHNLYKIAVCFACQLTEKITPDPFDVRPDRLVTENNIF